MFSLAGFHVFPHAAISKIPRFTFDIKPNCQVNIWKIRHYFDDNTHARSEKSQVWFGFAALENKIIIEEEFQVYNIKQWIGDFGGYLGLLFGASIPSLFELLQSLFDKIKRHSVLSNFD